MKTIYTLLCLLLFISPAFGGETARSIRVGGNSEITLEPQYSIIYTDLKFLHPEISTSYQNLQQTLSDIINELKTLGIVDKEITKSIIRQGTEYTWRNNSRIHAGFYASCSMQIRVNDIANIHLVYNKLSQFKALAITGTGYGRNDIEEVRILEFKKALLVARKKAELMAKELGVSIGAVLQISETEFSRTPSPLMRMHSDTAAAPERTGGTFGSVTISAHVGVEFALE